MWLMLSYFKGVKEKTILVAQKYQTHTHPENHEEFLTQVIASGRPDLIAVMEYEMSWTYMTVIFAFKCKYFWC